ncbi:hypothetical protein R1sor_022242 [Riccia sorocarpa]|uniref:Reverse transcriptase domain-containing protein n=1 Tax=Riccia sorocarpa TaxID=122646 RepID=A0ABD3GN40_9MARC
MLREVYKYYRDLYKAEEDTEEVLENRRIVVGRIDRSLTGADNNTLEEVPTEEFITEIVMDMPKEKSPGIDGVMVEILQTGWEFMQEDCFQMVQSFWTKKELIGKDSRGIIKLLPKNDRKHLLKNWRPITLLTMTYKIVAKIIAVRLKGMLPRIIDTQQTGFVAGRNIIDNILSLRLGQEWAHVTNQQTIFVKLDFMKAYDRVAHGFLWDTLTAIGVGVATLDRIKGLVRGGSSEVHINGSFTEVFKIERGVRQGCPLAPLLFAMTTQPLMRALREEERKGNIQGLNIGGGQSLLHQLFADDTGICITAEERQFDNLKEAIREFEVASGASLNLQKSILMSVGMCKDGLEELEKLCRNFLWGWNEEGNPKHALIAWDRIAQVKDRGGLGWVRFKDMADALFVRQINRVLENGRAEWIQLARSFILRTLRKGAYQRECSQWSLQECLLLLPLTKVEGSPTLTRMLRAWYRARQKLQWKGTGGELDASMTMLQVKAVYQLSQGNGIRTIRTDRELGLLKRAGIGNLEDAMEILRTEGWKNHLRKHGVYPEEEELVRLEVMENWCSKHKVVWKGILELEGWSWENPRDNFKWSRSTREWRLTFTKEVDFSRKLDEKWNFQSSHLSWHQRWKLVWAAPIPYRRRVWIWRILQRGIFTNSRAAEMGFEEGLCKRCGERHEDVEHIMWDCRKIEGRRRNLTELMESPTRITNLLEWFDEALARAQNSPACLLVCILHIWHAWRERNEWQFNNKAVNIPVYRLLREVELEINALGTLGRSEERMRSLSKAREEVGRWIGCWVRRRQPG